MKESLYPYLHFVKIYEHFKQNMNLNYLSRLAHFGTNLWEFKIFNCSNRLIQVHPIYVYFKWLHFLQNFDFLS